jgi:8-oxo-dGTP pyrophosphatase MutT (NUDIX family)
MALVPQAGAIAVRQTSDEPEVLLVRAKTTPHDWIFPKGHQERGETLAQTAIRELMEEGGITGAAVGPVGVSRFRSADDDIEVTYFLVRFTGTLPAAERETTWRSLPDAKTLVSFEDARRLLDRVRQMLAAQ